MRAAVLPSVNESIRIEEIPKPDVNPGRVLLRMVAGALNHRDVFIQQGKYARIRLPCIMGSDGVGVVEAVGTGVNPSLTGKRMLVFPSVEWGDSERVQGKTFRVLGMPDPGTLVEYRAVHGSDLTEAPQHLTDSEAAALPLAGLTAYRALFIRGGMQAGQKVLITGIGGGVATMALQFAIAAKTNVWVTSGNPEKIEAAKKLGAKGGTLYTEKDWYKSLKEESGGFDLILDSAGGPDFAYLLEVANPAATIVTYGGTRGPVSGLSPQRLYWKQLNILGSTMGSPADFKQMLEFVSQNRIRPVVDRVFPLIETQGAFDYLAQGRQQGKVVIQIAN